MHVIGWRERVDLPEWGVKRLLAKADTGARSSAVHAERIEHVGSGVVAFDVVYSRAHPDRFVRVEAPIVRETMVRSSSGHEDARIVVSTLLRAGPFERRVEMTLVSRELMQCRLLIGRTAMEGALVVDPSNAFLLTPKFKTKRKRGSA
jgi:hypothetical protein